MSISIGDSFSLAGYGPFRNNPKSSAASSRHLYVSHCAGSSSSDGYSTITAQGDGLHVLDIAALHPVASQTLGPSTFFTCPAVSRTTLDGDVVTYAGIESSSDLSDEEARRTIWMWNVSPNSSGDSRKKHSALVSHKISRIYLSDDLPDRVLTLSPMGDLTLSDADLKFKSMLQSENTKLALLKSFIFSSQTCSFVNRRSAPPGVIVFSIFVSGNEIQAQVIAVDIEDAFHLLGDFCIPLGDEATPDTISDISCSDSGHLSILTYSGIWHSYSIESVNDVIEASPSSEPLHLASLSAFTGASPSDSKHRDEVSLLSLGSSFVMLVGITKSPQREIIFLIWDLQYSVALASHSTAIPTSLTETERTGLSVELVAGGKNQALILMSPTAPLEKSKASAGAQSHRSVVLVVPFSVPPISTIATAMGHASDSTKWLAHSEASSIHSELDPSQIQLLKSMRTLIGKNRPEGAGDLFFEWEQTKEQSGESPDTRLSQAFVKELLDITLQPSKPANVPYSSKVLQHLMEKRVVSHAIIQGGLFGVLRLRSDWSSIAQAFKTVLDIPEADIISALQTVVTHYRGTAATAEADITSMEVDESSVATPSLPSFLKSCVSYTSTPASLRLAIRHNLPDAADVLSILKVLDLWLVKWAKTTVILLPSVIIKNPKGIYVPKPPQQTQMNFPPVVQVLDFLQTLLDASFLNLLQHPPAHNVLRRISAHIEPEIHRVDEIEQLRGPLEPFARNQMKALRESVEGRREPQIDWRKRRKAAHEQTSMTVGLYRLEELVI